MKSVWARLPVSPAGVCAFPLPEMATAVGGRCMVMAYGPFRKPAGEDPGEWRKAMLSVTLSVTAGGCGAPMTPASPVPRRRAVPLGRSHGWPGKRSNRGRDVMDQQEQSFFPLDPMEQDAVETGTGVSVVFGGTAPARRTW